MFIVDIFFKEFVNSITNYRIIGDLVSCHPYKFSKWGRGKYDRSSALDLVVIRFLMKQNSLLSPLEAQVPGTTQDHLQIFNIEAKQKIKSYQMPEQVISSLMDSFF